MLRAHSTGVLGVLALLSVNGFATGNPATWDVSLGGNGHTYEFVNEVRTWEAAVVASAERINDGRRGHLVTLTSAAESDFVEANILGFLGFRFSWIGLSQPTDERNASANWRWVTGEPFDFTRWAPSEPGDHLGPASEQVAAINGAERGFAGGWADFPGDFQQTAIVEYSTPRRLATWPVTSGGNGSTYELVELALPWNEAREFAGRQSFEGRSGHLASLSGGPEFEFVAANLLSDTLAAWIGLSQPASELSPSDGWAWEGGDPFTFANWGFNEPNDQSGGPGSEQAAFVFGGASASPGVWADAPTSSRFVFLIEYPAARRLVQWSVEDGGNGHYYEVVGPALQWGEARVDAARREAFGVQGHLATLTSVEENNFVVNAVLGDVPQTWIGLFRTGVGAADFEWVTGEPFSFQNWGTNQPNDDSVFPEPFGVLYGARIPDGFSWHSFPPIARFPSVVEFDAESAVACSAADVSAEFGVLDINDVLVFADRFGVLDPVADLTGDGVLNINDVLVFASLFVAGCP